MIASRAAPAAQPASFHKQPSRVCLDTQGPGVPDGFDAAWQATASAASGALPVKQLQCFLELVQLQASSEQLHAALQHLGRATQELSRDDTAVLCQILATAGHVSPLTCLPSSSSSSSSNGGQAKARTGSGQCLESLEPGRLQADDAVLAYMQRLEEHRKRCELSGRYAEAAAAAGRVQGLKATQTERLRGELAALQCSEMSHMQERYQQEIQVFGREWRERVAAYEAGVAGQLATLRAGHEAQVAAFLLQCEVGRPAQPQHSTEYLNSRKIEEVLVKQGQYRKAHKLKVAADHMYHEELASTHMAWESEVELRKMWLLAKQRGELDVLLQRVARGRDELELRRLDETERRHNRFRCMVQEVDGMQRLEAVHLEHFLEGQALPGKYMPLRDSAFRRKRELLGLQRVPLLSQCSR